MRIGVTLAGGVVVCMLLLGSCSTNVDGTPVTAPSSPVDVSTLDTGTYSTSPVAQFGLASADEKASIEGQRMAEFTTLPFEIDPRFTAAQQAGVVVSKRDVLTLLQSSKVTADAAADIGIVSGYYSLAQTSDTANDTYINHGVIRFVSPDSARKGARTIFDKLLTDPATVRNPQYKLAPIPVPGIAGALGLRSAGTNTSIAITPHNDYVTFDAIRLAVPEAGNLPGLLAKSVNLQQPLIDKFPKTPLKGADVQIDQNKILLYSMDDPRPEFKDLFRAVYGPRGEAHLSANAPKTLAMLEKAGSTYNAEWLTSVSRAATPAQAKQLQSDFIAVLESTGYEDGAAPKGLPDAKCLFRDTPTGQRNDCLVTVGRYIGQSHDVDPVVSRQIIAAQYVILTKADQNAN